MGNIGVWLLAIAWPVAKKVLVMLGIGFVSYAGISTLTSNVIAHAQSNWGAVSGAMFQLSSLGGIPDVLGIICGALVARASLMAVDKLQKIAS